MDRTIATSRWAVGVAAALAVVKLAVGLSTRSLSVTASAADSLLDAIVSSMNLFALTVARQPPDADHRFGHGKAEGIAALLQGALLTGVGLTVAGEAIRRWVKHLEPTATAPGIGVMALAFLATALLVRRMRRVAQATGSLALEADAHHYASDLWVNAGIALGLGVYRFTGLAFLDPLLSLVLAAPILRSGAMVLRSAADVLMDHELPADERERVIAAIEGMGSPVLGYHDLRTRRSGAERHIDLHLHVLKDVSFEEAHRLTHVLIRTIKGQIANAQVTVHAEPVDEQGARVHVG